MKFISIDSSLRYTGIAVGRITKTNEILVDKILLTETKKTKNKQIRASSDTIQRCRKTHQFVHDTLNSVKPDVIFVETPSGSQNSSAMKSYGAVCALIASITSPPPIEVTPIEVKVAYMGNKTASKESIIKKASETYPDLDWFYHQKKLQNKNEHMADAIAIVHAGVLTDQFKQIQQFIQN